MLAPKLQQQAAARIKQLQTTADNLLTATLKASQSYHSELGSKTFEQLLKDKSQQAADMCKLIKEGARIMEKRRK